MIFIYGYPATPATIRIGNKNFFFMILCFLSFIIWFV